MPSEAVPVSSVMAATVGADGAAVSTVIFKALEAADVFPDASVAAAVIA